MKGANDFGEDGGAGNMVAQAPFCADGGIAMDQPVQVIASPECERNLVDGIQIGSREVLELRDNDNFMVVEELFVDFVHVSLACSPMIEQLT